MESRRVGVCLMTSKPLSGIRCRLFASHEGEQGSIPGGVALRSSHVGIVLDDAAGRRVFSGISRFPPPLYSYVAPYSPRFTLIGSQDLAVKSHLNLPTPITPRFVSLESRIPPRRKKVADKDECGFISHCTCRKNPMPAMLMPSNVVMNVLVMMLSVVMMNVKQVVLVSSCVVMSILFAAVLDTFHLGRELSFCRTILLLLLVRTRRRRMKRLNGSLTGCGPFPRQL
ncbi:hypothetical protein PR048_012475 [Dryococelus australis]|uniref:Transmembrane protein n=1 Tax=Dryococelus australis TaxID=614101 RepID=A0ABQ9HQB3_9NEOP|nr:hypothetical protein PR048_012475 [Dryococelus australis]